MYFAHCKTMEEARDTWRELMKEHHPDHGGDVETAKTINAAFDAWVAEGMGRAFRERERASKEAGRGWTFEEDAPYRFASIAAQVARMMAVGRVEIIGTWVYAFDSYGAREALAGMGFHFSGKHRAWIYNGEGRLFHQRKSRYTTDDLRAKWGSVTMEEEKTAEVSA